MTMILDSWPRSVRLWAGISLNTGIVALADQKKATCLRCNVCTNEDHRGGYQRSGIMRIKCFRILHKCDGVAPALLEFNRSERSNLKEHAISESPGGGGDGARSG